MKLNGFWGLLAFVNGQGTDHTKRKKCLKKNQTNERIKTEQMTRENLSFLSRKIRTFGYFYPKLKSLRIHDFIGFIVFLIFVI